MELQVQPVPTMLERLDVIGVDYSVSAADITDWLNNPQFTPYPALADSLLNLFDGKHLRRPVYLDVIAFNYESSPGNPSPRRVDDVDAGVLKAAVVEGSNNRYGEAVSNFQELLAP
ncbi:hypothetical protein QQ44_08215 [Mycolicibacterium setense]|uniref:Uncharacterized protein n=1 Tax=Mycolicibacterium setense TaxID=431269 RepID=A0ABR4YZK8_9MYCO|nr:hypothetical protein QQ44_08215 [Mycolicibacterium setense]